MARRKSLTDDMIRKMKPVPGKRLTIPDPDLRGHYVRVTPSGQKTFTIVARDPFGKQLWREVGPFGEYDIEKARKRAAEGLTRIKGGLEPFPPAAPKPDTFQAVAENYLLRHVKAEKLRSQDEIERCFRKYVFPHWKDREFTSLKRSDVARLLDAIQDERGKWQADAVLAQVSSVFNWYMNRNDDYASPLSKGTKGIRRVKKEDRKRSRFLNDDEIRIIWKVAEGNGTFGAIIRLALLTVQRKEKVASMRWKDISVDGEWVIPGEKGEKGHGGTLRLTEDALAIIRAQKRIEGNPFVFAGRGARKNPKKVEQGESHFCGWSASKIAFDKKVLKALQDAATAAGNNPKKVEQLERWTIHDLRRTGRTLMSRAKVDFEIAERTMGHKMQGVASVYDQHTYVEEKADALAKLAAEIGKVLNPDGAATAQPEEKITHLRARKA